MTASVTHKPKGGAKLTGTEYEAADSHVVAVAHADLSSVTSDQHHAQSHTHNADGSGTVAHSATSGITATDHHAAAVAGPDANDTIDSAGAAGTASTFARSGHGHQVVTTDAPSGANVTIDAAPTAGTTGAIARATHGHRLNTSASVAVAIGTAAAGTSGHSPSRDDHVHPTGAGTPSTSAMGDAATTGSGPAASMTDHKHARATATLKLFLAAALAKLDSATAANVGASPDLTGVVAYADAATQGAIWTFMVPSDWVSGVINLQPVWSPGSTDGTAHTVRWSMTAKAVASGSTVTAAGTTTAFTGASAARTVGVVVYDTATSTTITPAAAGDLFRFTLQRIGADANDTYVGVVNLLGVIVSYTANT